MAVKAIVALVFYGLMNRCSSAILVLLPSGFLLLPATFLLPLDLQCDRVAGKGLKKVQVDLTSHGLAGVVEGIGRTEVDLAKVGLGKISHGFLICFESVFKSI